MPHGTLDALPDLDAFIAASQRTVWAATALACGALAGISWTLLAVRERILGHTRYRLLLNFGTALGLILALVAVGWVYDTVFDPWHHLAVWCLPPTPYARYFLVATPIVVTLAHRLRYRSQRAV